jgi:hypothetical protein
MCPGLMSRTDAQRRFDALFAIFHAAAAMNGDATGTAVTVNLVVGLDAFEHHLEKALGGDPAPLDPNDPMNRCETDGGVVIDPYDMLIAAATGHVRRVVLDSPPVWWSTWAASNACSPVRCATRCCCRHGRCTWPGCNVPRPTRVRGRPRAALVASRAHQHPQRWPLCGHHNRWKSRGYRTWRDPDGHWHHYRPDGTEIGWRAAPNPLHLYDPAQLAERSAGYFGESWSSDWLVIGDVGGDPVIADTALPGTPISLAMHGAGIWRPMTVAPTPASFLAAVAAWLRVLLAYDGEHLDAKNDFCVKPGFYQALTEHLRAVLPDDCVRALIEYLET